MSILILGAASRMSLLRIFLALGVLSFCVTEDAIAQKAMNSSSHHQLQAADVLDAKQQNIVAISAFTAKGDLTKLQKALNDGLDAGLTINQIKEVLVHLYAYCGFPRSLRGLQTLMAVTDERKGRGIHDKLGDEASPVRDERSRYERGKEILEKLTGAPQAGPPTGYAAFAPVVDTFLKEHLFAHIFERDVLSHKERELVTVSALSSMGGVEPMLRSHLAICLNVGITPSQLQQFIGIIKSTAGKKEAKAAQIVLDEVLTSNPAR